MKNVGGQALIEGIMMKNSHLKSISIRKSSGEILTKTKELKENPVKNIPILRGIYIVILSAIEGSEDINYSSSFFEEDFEPKKDSFLKKYFKIDIDKILQTVSFIFAILIAVFMLSILPAILTKQLGQNSNAIFSIIEGIIKIFIFIIYIYGISHIPDIKRVFMYHGAEHKSIFAYERGLDLTIENIKSMPRLHPRCGTNFITVTLIISIIANSFIQIDDIFSRIIVKMLIFPLIAGVSYEIIKIAGKSQNILTKLLILPGMFLQKITTKEPDEQQIEVAIEALKKVI